MDTMRSPTAPLLWPDITALSSVLVIAANLHRAAAVARTAVSSA
jgi:hypothetical protein